MAKWNIGPKNGLWKGGRIIASNGYVLVRVGKDHPAADVRGYAYEHRLVAAEKLGRPLKKGELIHHVNGNKQDNSPENIEVTSGVAEHLSFHRKRKDLRPYGAENPIKACECGCGQLLSAFDSSNRPRKFISGHNMKAQRGRQ